MYTILYTILYYISVILFILIVFILIIIIDIENIWIHGEIYVCLMLQYYVVRTEYIQQRLE